MKPPAQDFMLEPIPAGWLKPGHRVASPAGSATVISVRDTPDDGVELMMLGWRDGLDCLVTDFCSTDDLIYVLR